MSLSTVMAGLDPVIHVLAYNEQGKTWMAGTSPGMTTSELVR